MYKYHCLNAIAGVGLNQFSDQYTAVEEIKNADFLRDLWENYSTHYQYANDIEFNQVINAIEKINTFIK